MGPDAPAAGAVAETRAVAGGRLYGVPAVMAEAWATCQRVGSHFVFRVPAYHHARRREAGRRQPARPGDGPRPAPAAPPPRVGDPRDSRAGRSQGLSIARVATVHQSAGSPDGTGPRRGQAVRQSLGTRTLLPQ